MSSVVDIAKAYFLTLKNQRTGGVNTGAIVFQMGVPIAAGAAWAAVSPGVVTSGNAIAGISVVSALLCAMATLLFQIRIEIRRDVSGKSKARDSFLVPSDVQLIDELFDAVVWAILFGLATVLGMVFADWLGAFGLDPLVSRFVSGTIVACIVHFVFVVGTILKRLSRAYGLVAKHDRGTPF